MQQCAALSFAVKRLYKPCDDKSVQHHMHLCIQHECSIIILLQYILINNTMGVTIGRSLVQRSVKALPC